MNQKVEDQEPSFFAEIHGLIKSLLKPLYHDGKTEELLSNSESMLKKLEQIEPSEIRDSLIADLHGCRAFAKYRQKDFIGAEQEALMAGKNETALRCLAAIAAYYYKDPIKLEFYANQVPRSTAIDNARQILARQLLSQQSVNQVSEGEIIERAAYWITVDPIDRVNTANIMNNTARWFFDYANMLTVCRDELVVLAVGYMQSAIGLYGSGTENLHHRAGAYFWVSKMQEKLFGKAAAISAAETSVKLWEKQLVVDITNKNFINSYNGAKKHLKELKNNLKQ